MMTLIRWLMLLLLIAGYGWGLPTEGKDAKLRGFFPAQAARQIVLEQTFRAQPTAERARQDLRVLARTSRLAGSPQDYESAQYVLNCFRQAGLEAKIVEYHVLLTTPREVRVGLVEPVHRPGPRPENQRRNSKTTADPALPIGFHAYSASGDVTAPVVYVNYGTPEDYQVLQALGVDVKGKIVIARYGRAFRGVKAYLAQQNQAAGLLLYSDPADDGRGRGEVYPRGPWRPPDAIERGSILFMTAYIGDPLTPGYAATPAARRLSMEDAPTLPRLPSAPLSVRDAKPILSLLRGPKAPREWQGGMAFPYHVGPGRATVRLKVDMEFAVKPIWNVVATIPGEVEPDSWVIVGNHRDAWTYGAVDPLSGTVPLLAVARGLGELAQRGWRPRRTIILASWDAEEYGLIGSTEWVEENAEHLARHAVAYLNTDVAVSGTSFGASAVPSLHRLLREVAEAVNDPNTGRLLTEVWPKQGQNSEKKRKEYPAIPGETPGGGPGAISDLGGGSDYTPFFQHVGVPALDFGFTGPYGVYHSAYDDLKWMELFGDPTFSYSVTAAQIWGTLALRLADADFLPFDFEDYGRCLQSYVTRLDGEVRNPQSARQLRLEDVRRAASEFTQAARSLKEELSGLQAQGHLDLAGLASLNRKLIQVERNFLLAEGLPDRAWFRHAIYAPGLYTGYGVVVFPGVREALARRDVETAAEQMRLVRAAIQEGTRTLKQALAVVKSAPPAERVATAP